MGLLCIVATGEALSCGIDWRLPQSHFEGVDEQGHVLYGEKIGDLDVAKDLQIPIYIMFKSNWMADSPCLGKGWMLPLLESRIEQMAERSYRIWQPNGWYRDFWCSKSSEMVLDGQGGWKAEIRGDTITAWASCGWKLVFTKNKLTAIVTQKNQRLDLVSRDGHVNEVRANGLCLLRVERDALTGRVKGLALRGGKRIAIEQQLRPRVQQIGEQKVVKGEDYSLAKMTLADGTVRTYEYGVDDQLRPTLKMGDRLIVWNPGTQLIVNDGEWTYDIKPDEKNSSANAAIGRKNTLGQTEFWHYDGDKGREITQGVDGLQRIETWFVNGKLAGATRKMEIIKDGKVVIKHMMAYNDQGMRIRETVNGRVTYVATMDKNNRVSSETWPGDHSVQYVYNESGVVVQKCINVDGTSTVIVINYNSQGKPVSRISNGETLYLNSSQ